MSPEIRGAKGGDKGRLLQQLSSMSLTEKHVRDFRRDFDRVFNQAFRDYAVRERAAQAAIEQHQYDLFSHWSNVAENLYREVDIRPTIAVREVKGTLEIGVDERQVLDIATRIYALPPELRSSKKGLFRAEIGSPMFNLFFGAFLSALKLSFGRIVEESGYSLDELYKIIDAETLRVPLFREVRGKLSYTQGSVREDELLERKSLVAERYKALAEFSRQRENEQPMLKDLVEKYGKALRRLKKDSGALHLFIVGMEIEALVRIKASTPVDSDRNVPLDADLLFVVRSLMIAHATLVSLFSDVEELAHELDRYSEQLTVIETLGDRIFDPLLDRFVEEKGIFDQSTLDMTAAIRRLDQHEEKLGLASTRQSVSAKHGWVRAAVGAIARVALRNAKEVANLIRDNAMKEIASSAVKHPLTLIGSVAMFLMTAQSALLGLADRLSATFGWLRSLLAMIGLS